MLAATRLEAQALRSIREKVGIRQCDVEDRTLRSSTLFVGSTTRPRPTHADMPFRARRNESDIVVRSRRSVASFGTRSERHLCGRVADHDAQHLLRSIVLSGILLYDAGSAGYSPEDAER